MKSKLLNIWGVDVDINDRELLEDIVGTRDYTEFIGELYNENGVSYRAVFINEDDHYGLPQFHIWGSDGSDCVISMLEPKYIRKDYYGDLELSDYGKSKLVEFFMSKAPTYDNDPYKGELTYWTWITHNFNSNSKNFNDSSDRVVVTEIPDYTKLR